MRKSLLSASAAALLAVVALGTAPAALGAGEGLGWSAPVYLSPEGATGLGPAVGVLADGTPVAVWDQSTIGGWFPEMATQPVGGGWTAPSPISSESIRAPGIYSFGPRMAVSSSGAYVATWLNNRTETVAGNPAVVPIVEGASGTIASGGVPSVNPQVFANVQSPHGFNYSYSPRVYMGADGNGVVSYLYSNCCGSTWSGMSGISAGAPTGTPGLPQTSLGSADFGGSNDDDSFNTPAVAVAGTNSSGTGPANSTMAALTTRGNSGPSPRQADLYTTTNPSAWGGPATTLPILGSGASVGVLADGRVIATSTTSDAKRVLWISGDAGARTIDDNLGTAGGLPPASIATAPDGSATIAYSVIDEGQLRAREVTVSPAGAAGAPVTLSTTEAPAHDVQAAYAPDGTTYVIWSEEGSAAGGTPGIYDSVRLPEGEFSTTPTTVIKNLTDAHGPRIAISPDGVATIVAQIEPKNTWEIAAFTHANPAVPRNLTLPKVTDAGKKGSGTVLSCSHGTWTASPTSYRYEWLVNGVSGGPPAAAATLKPSKKQLGKKIACRVTATNQNGSGIATSAAFDTGAKSKSPKVTSIKAKGDVVTVKVSCPGTACAPVTVTLSVPQKAHGAGRIARPKKKGRQLTVGRATATVKPGHSKTIAVRLNKAGSSLLARRHKLKVTVTVSARKKVVKRGSVVLQH